MAAVAADNIQGLITQRYAYPIARHFLLSVSDASQARACLRRWLPRITRASTDLRDKPEPLLNIGVTWQGLRALAPADRFAGAETDFPADFREQPPQPMAGTWKGQFSGDAVHVVLCMHCRTEAGLDDASRALRNEISDGFGGCSRTRMGTPPLPPAHLADGSCISVI